MTRPRAADDFPAIRARMDELRRERAGESADKNARRMDAPRPYAITTRPALTDRPGLSPAMRRAIQRATD